MRESSQKSTGGGRGYGAASIEPNDVIVDVGSHVGIFCMLAARKASNGRVVAIEPATPNRKLLIRNVALNGLKNVRILDCALSDKSGEADIFFPGDHAMFTLHPKGPTPFSHRVEVRTLDDVFESEKIFECSLLKIDAEKSELDILRGGIKALSVTRQLLVEAEKDHDDHKQVIALLQEKGFVCSTESDTPGAILIYASRMPRRVEL